MSEADKPAAAEHEEEVQWTDDRVRWDEEESAADRSDGADGGDESEDAFLDPFKDPDPRETFSFSFPRPDSTISGDDDTSSIDIELRGYKYESDQIWKSTGLTLWRASRDLCDYLVEDAELIRNKRMLELGAGLGLCGILAHRLNSIVEKSNDTKAAVFLTDGDTDVLAQLRDNVARNTDASCGTISCHQLLWGEETSKLFLERHGGGQTFDVLFAADIVYAPAIVQPLWETVRTLLNRTSGMFLLAYTQRDLKVSIDDVLSAGKEAGFSYVGPEGEIEGIYVFRWQPVVVEEIKT